MNQELRRRLGHERYVNLETFRRNGSGVKTPVWAAEVDGRLYVVTDGTAAKVKRLRATQRIRLAPCDWRGGVTGDWLDGTGRVVDDHRLLIRANEALTAKYGWQMWLLNVSSAIGGRVGRRAILELEV